MERKLKAYTSAGKVTASVFWDSEGMSLMEFLKRGATNQFTVTCADVKEVKTKNLKVSAKQED
jgi:hypothetical protein